MVSKLFPSANFTFVILAILLFLSFFFLIRSIFSFLLAPEKRHHRRLQQRLRELEGLGSTYGAATLLNQASLKQSILDKSLDKFRLLTRLQTLMLQAHLTWKRATFLVVAVSSGLLGLGLGLMQWGSVGALAGGVLGLYLPYKILVLKGKRRLQKFERQLPDALDLLARGLRAGHAFPMGLQQVAKEMAAPLGTEFLKTYTEFSHGLELNRALLALCDRIKLQDLNFFTTAVLIQRETGGNLTDILEKIAVLIRERFKLRNQIQALTAEGRLSGLILILLPPLLGAILMVINPEYERQLFQHPAGRLMCGVALILQLMGMYFIHKIVNIKV